MLEYAASVSGTLFHYNKAAIKFSGPSIDNFVDIAKRTISVLNNGRELSDFGLTHDDLTETRQELLKLSENERTIREYLSMVYRTWEVNSGYLKELNKKIPKPTEVWFVFSYPDAESSISTFIRKSERVEDAWSTIHDKLYEYIHSNTQRSSIWSAKRLQLALYGAIKTRILFLPSNCFISTLATYSDNLEIKKILEKNSIPTSWNDKSSTKTSFKKAPLYKQLMGENFHIGKRKGGPAAKAIDKAKPAYTELVTWVSGQGQGSDKHLNKCIELVINDTSEFHAVADKAHPWIKNIIPDLFIDLPQKQICLEFHYTNKEEPGIIADYVLRKLNVYMNQLENLLKR